LIQCVYDGFSLNEKKYYALLRITKRRG